MNYKIFAATQLLLEKLAQDFLLLSQQEKVSHLSLSGGSTPILLFKYLAKSPYAQSINWQKLHFWWGDERCVAPSDPESNFGQCKPLLFDNIIIPAENIHRIRGENSPQQEAVRYAQEIINHIDNVNGIPQFDWILLGVGGDGHTASLFPGQTNYQDPHLTLVATQPQSGQLRVSKTAGLIENSQRITYLVLGEGKADIIHEINIEPAGSERYPAGKIKATAGLTEWYLDSGSAKLLTEGHNDEC
ncbi:6-phosphogluconolactonase [Psychromonas sp. MB-3u-54]|uniref:6-phosphogluconolactonase n=1 Tax=Psychromonas sp. MB-3u-54 TaxID=2058319 RepID=UPI000C327295|nr:6-phosphogluconolactonase [Psychromonas sp. MB-3u-54]PKH02824.1 6-phosphogluconolactonase [Psychromonas sp. MB-3u-54]